MKYRIVTHGLLCAIAFLLFAISAKAEENKPVYRCSFTGGIAYSDFRDMGVSPITYSGPALNACFAFSRTAAQGRLSLEGNFLAGLYQDNVPPRHNFNNSSGLAQIRLKYLHQFNAGLNLGASVDNIFLLSHNSTFGNASFGAGDVTSVNLHLGYQTPLVLFRNKKTTWFVSEIAFAPISLQFRPGFAYIDNYTEEIPTNSTYFNQYQWYFSPFSALEASLGILIGRRNLTISYHWQFITTWENAPHRMDFTTHSLQATWQLTKHNNKKNNKKI